MDVSHLSKTNVIEMSYVKGANALMNGVEKAMCVCLRCGMNGGQLVITEKVKHNTLDMWREWN